MCRDSQDMSPFATAEDVPESYIPHMMEQGENSCHHSYTIPYLGNSNTCHLLDPSKANESVRAALTESELDFFSQLETFLFHS